MPKRKKSMDTSTEGKIVINPQFAGYAIKR
jgi:hypothetical protein